MSWITLNAEDVRARLDAPEWQAVSEHALAAGQGDPWTPILADVTNHIRGLIGGGSSRNTLGEDGTLPVSVKRHAISFAIWDGLGRFGLSSLLGETRKLDYERADSYFAKIASGSIVVEKPDTAGAETFDNREGGFQTADPERSVKRRATRGKLNGLC